MSGVGNIPPPPADMELCNIIDKLANFVARNGPEFESMTKTKQQNNAKFSFLFGGEYHDYYQWRVRCEQSMISEYWQQQQQQPPHQVPPHQEWVPQEWIQQPVPMPPSHAMQQHSQMISSLGAAAANALHESASSLGVDISEIDAVVCPLMSACTKDAICAGKQCCLNVAARGPEHANLLSLYLLDCALNKAAGCTSRLHLIYLINDVIHHCCRRSTHDLHAALQSVVVAIFCAAHIAADSDDRRVQLDRLLGLWDQHGYFDPHVIQAMQSPTNGLSMFTHPSLAWGAPPPAPNVFDYAHGKEAPPTPVHPPAPPPPTEMQLLKPELPYYDLPAGLMCPLVKLSDVDYTPLRECDIRLPPPLPPSDRLLAAVDAFYSPPDHQRPRSSEGWEQNGLYEYFRSKQKYIAKRKNLQSVALPSFVNRSGYLHKKYLISDPQLNLTSTSNLPPPTTHSLSPHRVGIQPITKDLPVVPQVTTNTPIDEDNKGHQLLKKMGWSGGGLGTKEQGIEQPILPGDVRDGNDKFKGVGSNSQSENTSDPFEVFRKSRSKTFISRIRARDEMRAEFQRKAATMMKDSVDMLPGETDNLQMDMQTMYSQENIS